MYAATESDKQGGKIRDNKSRDGKLEMVKLEMVKKTTKTTKNTSSLQPPTYYTLLALLTVQFLVLGPKCLETFLGTKEGPCVINTTSFQTNGTLESGGWTRTVTGCTFHGKVCVYC